MSRLEKTELWPKEVLGLGSRKHDVAWLALLTRKVRGLMAAGGLA